MLLLQLEGPILHPGVERGTQRSFTFHCVANCFMIQSGGSLERGYGDKRIYGSDSR
jgi:hypothetical protein